MKYPKRILIELTNYCNRSCKMCPRKHMKDPLGYMEVENFKKIIDEIEGNVDTVFLGWRGEPILHPMFAPCVRYARERVKKLETATGAYTWTPWDLEVIHMFDFINISLHGPKNAELVKLIPNYRKEGKPFVQITVVDCEDTVKLAESLADDVNRIKIKEEHTVDGIWGHTTSAQEDGPDVCPRLQEEMVIGWNGSVSRCCLVWETENRNVFKDGVKGIWNSQPWSQRREFPLNEVCLQCDQWGLQTQGKVTGETL